MRISDSFAFRGRIGRKSFWLTWLGSMLLLAFSAALISALAALGPAAGVAGAVLGICGAGAACWLSLATQVKRWHDLNRSGWTLLISFIPVLGFLACIICLGFLPGTPGPNRFDLATGPVTDKAGGPVPAPPVIPVPPRLITPRERRYRALVFGVLAVAALSVGLFFALSPAADWAVRRSWMRAVLGSAEECQAMAWRYREGEGVPQDYSRAREWFERAAEKGLARAQYDLGVLYFYGLGVPADTEKARTLLQAAVHQEYVPALTLLGLLDQQEEPNNPAAVTFWTQAAEAGDGWAESLLGSAYLARRNQGEGRENLIVALYWLESAHSHGAEPVAGLLQHAWATVAVEDLEAVSGQVFGRLARGKPDPVPDEAPVAAVAAVAAASEANADNAPSTDATAPASNLGEEVLARVRTLPDYTLLSTLYAERSQADSAWPASEEGQAVGQYLENIRTDALTPHVQKADDGTLTLEYSIGGNTLTDDGVRIADLDTDADYRRFIVDALAKNIVSGPRPMKVSEFVKNSGKSAEESK